MATEKRLIDANDFIKNFWQRVHDGEIVTLMDVEHAIINAPTVDAVEVVRCKDCKWYNPPGGVAGQKTIICSRQPKDFFCSYGERRWITYGIYYNSSRIEP